MLLLEISISCRARAVYSYARALSLFLLTRIVLSSFLSDEMLSNINYEMTCWIDCMSKGAVRDFGRVLEASSANTYAEISLFRAWKNVGLMCPMPNEMSSGILVTAIKFIYTDCTCSSELEALVCQVAAKCLVFNHNPMPLAALVTSSFGSKKSSPVDGSYSKEMMIALGKYAKCLVEFESTDESTQSKLLFQLFETCFAESSFHRKVTEWLDGDAKDQTPQEHLGRISLQDSIAAIRQLSHVVACISKDALRQRSLSLLRLLLCVALEVSSSKRAYAMMLKPV